MEMSRDTQKSVLDTLAAERDRERYLRLEAENTEQLLRSQVKILQGRLSEASQVTTSPFNLTRSPNLHSNFKNFRQSLDWAEARLIERDKTIDALQREVEEYKRLLATQRTRDPARYEVLKTDLLKKDRAIHQWERSVTEIETRIQSVLNENDQLRAENAVYKQIFQQLNQKKSVKRLKSPNKKPASTRTLVQPLCLQQIKDLSLENKQLSKANLALERKKRGLAREAKHLSTSVKSLTRSTYFPAKSCSRKTSIDQSLLATERQQTGMEPQVTPEFPEANTIQDLLARKDKELQLIHDDRERLQKLASEMKHQLSEALTHLETRQS